MDSPHNRRYRLPMFLESRTLPQDTEIVADLCIIGAGAAGMTIARELFDSGLDIVILESGGETPDPDIQALGAGSNTGRKYFSLQDTGTRAWGGATNCWGGLCAPLDPIDFEKRDWVPHSGWPITYDDLHPWYERAHAMLGLGPFQYRGSWKAGKELTPFNFGKDAPLASGVFHIAQSGIRLGVRWRDVFERQQNVRVFLNATVSSLDLEATGQSVQTVTVKVLKGAGFTVRARAFVLAAGGIQNPRVLLNSNTVQRSGIGNAYDNVGRYFMDHPHTDYQGVLVASPRMRDWSYYKRAGLTSDGAEGKPNRYGIWGYLQPTAKTLRREKMLNVRCVLFSFAGRAKGLADDEIPLIDPMQRVLSKAEAPEREPSLLRFSFGTPSEAAPNPASRVTLSQETDEIGVRRAVLNWALSPVDKYTVRRMHELIAECVGRVGLGRMRLTLSEDDQTWPRNMHGGRHLMGTTRMSEDPKKGVCDRDGRVHGVHNLYVAGSSLFTTSGSANPTLTILALALRQAKQLNEELG